MKREKHISDDEHLRQAVISQCIWSDTYSSLKDVLKQTANQLPLLVSFDYGSDAPPAPSGNNNDNNNNNQIILFFDRNVSKKTLFTPLRQIQDYADRFEVHPHNCTFAMTDSYKGKFKFKDKNKKK